MPMANPGQTAIAIPKAEAPIKPTQARKNLDESPINPALDISLQ
jgi:hypothetical protein